MDNVIRVTPEDLAGILGASPESMWAAIAAAKSSCDPVQFHGVKLWLLGSYCDDGSFSGSVEVFCPDGQQYHLYGKGTSVWR